MNPIIISRFWSPIAALAVVGGLGAVTYHFTNRATAAEEGGAPVAMPPPKVTIAAVEQRTVVDHQELLGRVEAIESVEVRPRVSGHIEEVRLKAGQTVAKGEVLFRIDPRWYKAQYDIAAAVVERGRVRVKIAENQARRTTDLLATRAVSIEEADVRESKLAEEKADLAAAEATLANARLDLEYTEVKAPISGRVSRAYVTAGNLISGSPGSGTLLTTIVSDGDVHVYADIDEATLLTFNRLSRENRIVTTEGRVPVEMELSDEQQFSRRGYIESTNNRLDQGTGSLVLRMVFPNPDGKLIPGLSARVRLPVSAPEPALFVNERSIGTNQNQKYVFTVAPDNTVAYRTVKLGPVVDGKRVIREGIAAGDRVITNGLQRVAAGAKVDPQLQ
ncbi:efflux RND transporter periplasmic adaptor subunit [Luteolibacter yonseiensis]|uniref:Efflux RND transporter periplasmic adaptor subunit n=1 Tax=Luteolibacter yonseiensis TaxID=1144680 RepID=A0A934R2B1_9BACT|nr:efflux RND transporter periplasmic adaptor subunit [Luteolibacter yonseiensis]MBK1815502.1 efflux RND transporter periplasmic adaptor subunit [Luteolibacter yonseiensis]